MLVSKGLRRVEPPDLAFGLKSPCVRPPRTRWMLFVDSMLGRRSARLMRLAARASRIRDEAIFRSRLARTARSIRDESSGSLIVVHHVSIAGSEVMPGVSG